MGDFEKAILLISSSVLWVGLAGLAFLGLIAVSRFQIRIVRHVSQQVRRWGVVGLAVAGLLMVVFTLHGGSKNTNGVPPRAGVFLRVTGTTGTSTNGLDRTGNTSQAITDEDISNGWRVVSVSCDAIPQSTFEMPTNAVVWEGPLRRGALRDRWLVPAGTWSFPFGDTVWTNGFLFTDQGFRGDQQDRANRIVLLGDEPLRKLVTTERTADNRFVNPSRLVYGTNATLRVGVNPSGLFSADEVCWSVVSGPGQITSPTNGWEVTVEATATNGEVVVEAKFNDDEIQPRFVLPIVSPKTLAVRVFVVDPPQSLQNQKWTDARIQDAFSKANEVFTQIGLRFEIVDQITRIRDSALWSITPHVMTNANGRRMWQRSAQVTNLLSSCQQHNCVAVYFTGTLLQDGNRRKATARTIGSSVILSRLINDTTLPHELGHVLGLDDCYDIRGTIKLPGLNEAIDSAFFLGYHTDWGSETGRGFYEMTDTRQLILGNLLMYGMASTLKGDIPGNMVCSLKAFAHGPNDYLFAKVGVGGVNTNTVEQIRK